MFIFLHANICQQVGKLSVINKVLEKFNTFFGLNNHLITEITIMKPKLNCNPSNIYWDISLELKNPTLM